MKAKELADLALDQPMTGLERAIWWTEYVLRHKGATHFRSTVPDFPLYQYFLLDVLCLCLTVLSVLLLIMYKLSQICVMYFPRIHVRKKMKEM